MPHKRGCPKEENCSRGLYVLEVDRVSKKLGPREQETYAIILALLKWQSWIGLQELLVLSDLKALESWYNEHLETPSGPLGRRGRWHEKFSPFYLGLSTSQGKIIFFPMSCLAGHTMLPRPLRN